MMIEIGTYTWDGYIRRSREGRVDRCAALISDQRRLTTARAEVGTRRPRILNQRDSVPYGIGWRIETC